MTTNGPALREARHRKLWTLRELSKVTGVAADTINRIENGQQQARLSTIRKLAAALDVDPETLIVWESNDVPASP